MRIALRLLPLLIIALTATITAAQSTHPFITGVDANYSIDLESTGHKWSDACGKPGDVFALLHAAGADTMRIRLWTADYGTHGLAYAGSVAKRSAAAGIKPYLVIFLSDNWADMVKQPVPAVWKDLNDAAKATAIEAYTEKVAKYFAKVGVPVDRYEIGNEIDFGLCGVFEEAWPHRVSIDYMQANIWSKMAPMILAAERGVKKISPNATFTLHLAQWQNAPYCSAFWKYMLDHGVQLDFAGLSYFPTSTTEADEQPLAFLLGRIESIHAAISRPVVICESGYPSAATFPGQFADWNKPITGYTLDQAGQAKWIADYFAAARSSANCAGAFYWSPDWYDSSMWSEFALFDSSGRAKPALQSLTAPQKPTDPPSVPTTAPKSIAPSTQSFTDAHVYFGNLHSHTGYSDGTGTPEQAYIMARDVAKLDFLAITEHNHILGGEKAAMPDRTKLYAGPGDEALIPTANRFNADGKFVAIYGQEFSSMSKGNHVNVFDVPDVIDVANGKFDNLLDWMNQHRDESNQPGVMMLNHPGLDLRINAKIMYGRDDFGDDKGWIAHMDPATSLIELLNGEPDAKQNQAAGRSPQIMEEDYRKYLNLGFHVAPTGDQDNHKIDWGTATETRTGIIAPSLTRAELLKAMRERHVYATEDKNLAVIVKINGHLAGDFIDTPGDATIDFQLTDADEPDADYTLDVFKGTIGKGLANVVKTVTTHGNGTGSFIAAPLDQEGQYVFVRVTQKSATGTDRAWTAPVWLKLPVKP